MNFTVLKSEKLSEQVIGQIKQMVYEGQLKKGDKLPSERELTTLLGVSRTSIREAFRALELLGLIESRQGEGTFISDRPLGNKIFEPLSLLFMLEDGAKNEFIDVRLMIEAECASRAALNASQEEVDVLLDCLEQFEKHADDQERCIEFDRRFHFTLVQAGRSVLLYQLYMAVSDVLNKHIAEARLALVRDRANISVLNEQHRDIYGAIAARSQIKARATVVRHLQFVKAQLYK
jgi:GntR family transcriptional repressor for pyruvate dehydrogenase complex